MIDILCRTWWSVQWSCFVNFLSYSSFLHGGAAPAIKRWRVNFVIKHFENKSHKYKVSLHANALSALLRPSVSRRRRAKYRRRCLQTTMCYYPARHFDRDAPAGDTSATSSLGISTNLDKRLEKTPLLSYCIILTDVSSEGAVRAQKKKIVCSGSFI